ncbi:MAG: PQQ-binding-like beta-propeller repeat protein [Thermoguttaceae bacterium]
MKFSNPLLPALFVLLFTSSNVDAAGPFWPVFHGPLGNNISTDTGLLKNWPKEGPKLLWKNDKIGDSPAGYSSVTIADGRLYTAGNTVEKSEKDGEEVETFYTTVYCLDLETGKTLWTYNNGPGWSDRGRYPGTRSTPTMSGEFVYDESPTGQLVCLDAKTGKKVWDVNIMQEFEAENITWALAESVLVDGDLVICAPGGKKASVVAFDKKTGKVVWTTPSTGELTNYATGLIFDWEGYRIVALMNQKGLIGVDVKTGKLLFSVEHETKFDINATIPTYFDEKLFIISGYGTGSQLVKLLKEGDSIKTEQLWAKKEFDNQHGGIVVVDGHAYGTTQNYKGGCWVCLRLSDGELCWNDRGVRKGACTFAEGHLYGMGEAGGEVALIKATPEKYEEISRFQLPEEGTGMFWAHPVICGKRLYLRHDNFLYCYEIAEK